MISQMVVPQYRTQGSDEAQIISSTKNHSQTLVGISLTIDLLRLPFYGVVNGDTAQAKMPDADLSKF